MRHASKAMQHRRQAGQSWTLETYCSATCDVQTVCVASADVPSMETENFWLGYFYCVVVKQDTGRAANAGKLRYTVVYTGQQAQPYRSMSVGCLHFDGLNDSMC